MSTKTKQPGTGSILVVNLRGLVNTRRPVRETLEQLHIAKRFNATIVPDNEIFRGMLRAAKEHVAWCKIDAETALKLLQTRAERSDSVNVSESEIKETSGFATFAELASAIASGSVRLDGSQGFRQFFRLNSPKGGFKRSIRRQYLQGGILGPNTELSMLVERMI